MKSGIKKKIILLTSMFIMFFMTMMSFKTTSYGNYQNIGSITWYYDVVNGEAVNVYMYSTNYIYLSSPLTIPDTLGGYPVTHLQGPSWSNENGNYPIYGPSNSYYVGGISEVILPNSLKRIGNYAFRDFKSLNTINLPNQLESIGAYAFSETNLKSITIPDSVISIGSGVFSKCKELENVTLGQGIVSLNGQTFNNCPKLNDFHVPSTVTTIDLSDFYGMKDIYIDNNEEDVTMGGERYISEWSQQYPYIHFLDSKQTINANLSDGIRLIDTETNESITEKDYTVGKNISLKVEKIEGSNIENYRVFIESEGDYYQTSPKVIEEVQVDENGIFTIENITRNKTIYVQESKNGLDLSLRQYISHINGQEIDDSREPVIKVENGKLNYNHDKRQILRKTGDIITYCLRVYNEGTIDGTANKISMFIPEGLELIENNFINRIYGWSISEDKRTATTEILKDKEIEAYSGATHIDYKDIYILLKVTQNSTEEQKRLVTIAEITESSSDDTDSTSGSITGPVDGTYMQEESEQSNENSYIVAQEDDNDYENILVSKTVVTKYNLRINKIDGLDNALLNGATFELYDENMEVLKTGVTANGGVLDFGLVDAFGPGTKKYYIKEVHTPEGYKNYLSYIIEVSIVTEIENVTNVTSKVELDIQDIDIDTSKFKTKNINSKEDFLAMENNQKYKYVLTQDIDLEGVEWTPMNLENVFLDGKNHKISNLTIEVDESTNKKVGLFATYSGIIENLTLDNVNIKVTKTAEEITENTEDDIHAVGGIVGYSKGTIFKNCKVTGKVESEVDNVGGLVGHSKMGTLDVYRSCTNEAEVSTLSSNAGGMIGTALGPVQVIASTNKGQITAGVYNAGGMVGTAESQGYTTDEVIGEYTDANESIQITVKNQKIEGNYKLKIEKIDANDKNILSGAKFTLYDRTKNPIEGYENLELTEGFIEIPKIVNHIGTDTYYLKEIQAPEGYEKISDEYIKIEISKTWNQEIEEYISIGSINILDQEEFEEDIAKAENSSEVATDRTYTKENTDVEWKLNKVSISKETVNEGNIIANNLNAAGLVGRAQCDVTITNSSNVGTIQAEKGNAAGVLGEQKVGLNDDKKLYIKNVTNTGAINQLANIGYSPESCSGIVGTINTDAEIYNTVNDGEITATQAHAAGIVANSGSDSLIIDNCTNNGNISIQENSADGAGILARGVVNKDFSWLYTNSLNEKSEHRITNCTNKGDVTGSYNVGGIVGESLTKKIEIYNCKLEDADITYVESGSNTALGGIAGVLNNDIVSIDNCTVLGGNIKSNGYNVTIGGIVGIMQDKCSYASYNNIPITQELTISNCNLTGVKVLGKGNTGGVLGHNYSEKEVKVLISNCNFINGSVKSDGTHGTYEQIGGIIGYAQKGDIVTSDCLVKNSDIGLDTLGTVSGDNNIGGIIGGAYNTKTIQIEDCNVEESRIFNISHMNPQGNAGGILGYSYSIENVIIKESNVKSTNFLTDNGSVGGLTGILQSTSKNDIIDCHVSNVTMEGEEKESKSNSYGIYAGITPMSFGKINIKDCTVTDSNLYNKNSSSAGIIMITQEEANIDNVIIDNTDIISKVGYNESTYFVSAGIVGYAGNNCNINNAIVKDSTIEGNNMSTAGILAATQSLVNIKDCEINNTSIKNTLDDTSVGTNNSYYTVIGGIAGNTIFNSESIIENCKVTNSSQIISKVPTTGGIVGYTEGNVKNCTFENSTITSQTMINNTLRGEIGGIVGTCQGKVEKSNVLNTNITANGEHVGGLIGNNNYYANTKIDECNVDNLTITHNNSVSFYNGVTYSTMPTKHVGGAIGTLARTTEISNSKFKNITINVVGNTVPMHVGGLIGLADENVQITSDNILENIKVNNASSGMTGGIIGLIKTDEEVNLSDLNFKNLNVRGTSHTGGIVGTTAKAKLNNIVVEGLQVQETGGSSAVGGLVGRIQVNSYNNSSEVVSNIIINNVELKDLNGKDNIIQATSGSHAGALVGLTERVELNTNTTDKIKVSNTRVNSTACSAGLIGQTGKINSIKNVELENVRMISNQNAGGVVGHITGQYDSEITRPIEISDVKATNVKVNTLYNAGGIIGINNSQKQLKIEDIELNNIETFADEHSGSIIGNTLTSELLNINNITASQIKATSSYDVGGLIGMSNNALEMIADNITVQNATVIAANAKGQYSQNVGGLVGATPNPKFSNVHITDININAQHLHHIGGLVGAATQMNSNSSQGAEFKNITIDASEGKANTIAGTTTDYSEYSGESMSKYGGILIGFVNKKAKVDGTINISNTTLKDNGGYYNVQSGFGGLIGFANEYENLNNTINNITLSNVNIEGTGRVGGIIGNVYTLSSIHDVTLQDVSIKNINGYAVSGLIGMAIKQQKGEGTDITFNISDINLNNLTVEGKNGVQHIGGLASIVPNVNIDNVVGENVTVKGNAPNSIGGLVGLTSIYNDATNLELETEISNINLKKLNVSSANGSSNVGGLVAESMKPRVKNVTLEDINITNNSSGSTAGIVGIITSTYIQFTNTDLTSEGEFSNITISKSQNAEEPNKIKGSNASFNHVGVLTSVGTVLTNTIGGTSKINVSDVDIDGRTSGATGIIGIASDGSDIKNIVANNINIQSGTQQSGIIAGIVKGNISNCDVNNSTITSNGTSTVGGIVGNVEQETEITNCNVKGITITTNGSTVGGLIGLSHGSITNSSVVDSTIKANNSNIWSVGGLVGGSTNSGTPEAKIDRCEVTNTNITANGGYLGGLAGVSDHIITNSKVIDSEVTSTGTSVPAVGGFVGILTNSNSTLTQINNCDVINTKIKSNSGYLGGIAGFSNNTITSSNVTGSTITALGEDRIGTGGIVGHGSNSIGGDTSIIGCKVIDTAITGKKLVGGISGGAVAKIQNCYVGQKDGNSYEEGSRAVTIIGTDGVGGIIGDPGVIYGDSYIMLTLQGNSINNVKIVRNNREREEGESDIIYALMGLHNRFSDTYTPEEPRTETISANTASNCDLNINQ